MFKSRKTKSIIVLALGAAVTLLNFVTMGGNGFHISLWTILDTLINVLLALALFFRAKGRKLPAVICAVSYPTVLAVGYIVDIVTSGSLTPQVLAEALTMGFAAILILYAANIGRAEHRWLWMILALALNVTYFFAYRLILSAFYAIPLDHVFNARSFFVNLLLWALIALGFWPLRPDCDAVSGTPTASRGA